MLMLRALKKIMFGCICALALGGVAFAASRVKDVTQVQGIRDNQLVGYGLVIGLAGTGDGLRNSPFTEQSMRSMLQRMGVGVEPGTLKSKNVAAVVVTANLPPFVTEGTRIDVSVASLGDATSLSGGTLIMTPLLAADGNPYAVAQGPVAVGGFEASGQAAKVTQGVLTSGKIANGAIVERDNTVDINGIDNFSLRLHSPDFQTVSTITEAINKFSEKKFGQAIASEHDDRSISIVRPASVSASKLFAELGEIEVQTDAAAKVIIDEKSGTIVIGNQVRILPVAISHGNLVIKVTENPKANQPNPLSNGETVTEPNTNIEIDNSGGPFAVLQGPSLEKLVAGLNKMGLKPLDIISILQSIKAAGALQAELIVQ